MVRRLAVVLIVAGAVLLALAPGVARANGRFPRAVKLLVRPGHPEEMALAVTFGLLVTRDDGAHWHWTCESAVGFMGTFDPDYAITASGTIYATTFGGVTMTRDGCHWSHLPRPLDEAYVPVITVGPDDIVYAAASAPDDNRVYRSTDDGVSFVPLGAVGQPADFWTSIEVAPSDPRRIYLTGFRSMGAATRQRVMFRSQDGGQTWAELPTTALIGTDISDLQIAAISPTDPERVLVRVTLTGPGLQETIYLTENAGTTAAAGPTWAKVYEVTDNIPGVVIRADGTALLATPFHGLQRSSDGGRTFAAVPDVMFEGRCLVERSDRVLFLCANDLPPDSRALTSSTTAAAGSWTPRLRFADLTAPIDCPVGTVQKDDCEAVVWCGLVPQLGVTSQAIDCPADIDAGIDAAGALAPKETCCDAGGGPPAAAASLALLGLMVPAWRRRRRARCILR